MRWQSRSNREGWLFVLACTLGFLLILVLAMDAEAEDASIEHDQVTDTYALVMPHPISRADVATTPFDIDPIVTGNLIDYGRDLACCEPFASCMYAWQMDDWGWALPDNCVSPAWRINERLGNPVVALVWERGLKRVEARWWPDPSDAAYRGHRLSWAGPGDVNIDGVANVFDLLPQLDRYFAGELTTLGLLRWLDYWFEGQS